MGNCTPAQSRPSQMQGQAMMMKQDPVWEKIRDYSFDRGHFYFVEQIQDIYTQIFGAYLIPDRVAMLVLEFKRFFFLVHKYYTRHQPITKSKQDSSLSFFPQPQMIASPILDRIWRLLLSNTKLYREFCDETLGGFLDRNLYINNKIDTYSTSLTCYQKQFGDASPLVEQNLREAYQGFFYIRAAEFIEFHQQFERAYVYAGKVDPEVVLKKQIADLREYHKRELKGKPGAVIWKEPEVKASPEPYEAPIKHQKVKVLQNNLEDDDIEMEDVESSQEEEEEPKVEEPKVEEAKEQEKVEAPAIQEEEKENKEEQVKQVKYEEANGNISIEVEQKNQKHAVQEQDSKSKTNEDRDVSKQDNGLIFSYDELKILNRYMVMNWQERYKEIKQKLEDYEIPKEVTHFFESDMNTTPELTQAVFSEFKRFILLQSLAVSESTFIPSHYVKVAWDNYIAQTVYYRQFCFQIFGSFIHSFPLPRQADDSQREAYVNTLRVYKIIFRNYPVAQIWPDSNDRFDYQTLYSYKYFNIYAYIVEVLNKIQQKPQQLPKQNEEEKRERRLSISSMSVSSNPSRGRQYISYKQRPQN